MKQKEKEKLFFKNKFAKRLFLSLAFLACSLLIVNLGFEINQNTFKFNHAQAFGFDGMNTNVDENGNVDQTKVMQSANQASKASSGGGLIGGMLIYAFNALLLAVFKLMGAILLIAANIFDWAIDANNFNTVMNMTSISEGWRMVRDFLNLFFILVLLFSAFCTIFQVEKYNIKKILLTLVIMALLVNFSFPISRFIIDAGNIPMYYFFQSIGGNNGGPISKNIFNSANSDSKGEPTGILASIYPSKQPVSTGSEQTLQLIAAIIFIFIFGMTLMVIAVLFVIRMLVLAILIIFSPVGFVASIFPGFSEYSSKWWNMLFKQSFFGTVMAFMLYISLSIMKQSQATFAKAMAEKAGNGSDFSAIIVGGVTLAIPITLLWIGIISAQSMGAMGAGAVVGQATKVAKWAGKKFSGYNIAKKNVDAFNAERKKREAEKDKHRFGGSIGRKLNKLQDSTIGAIPIVGNAAKKRVDKMKEDERRKDMDDEAKKSEDTKTIVNMINNINNSTSGVFNSSGDFKPGLKISDAQAGDAKAYTRKSSDDKKDFIADELVGKVIIAGTNLENVLGNVSTDPANRVRMALTAILGGSTNEQDLRTIATHVGKQMEEVMKQYVKQ